MHTHGVASMPDDGGRLGAWSIEGGACSSQSCLSASGTFLWGLCIIFLWRSMTWLTMCGCSWRSHELCHALFGICCDGPGCYRRGKRRIWTSRRAWRRKKDARSWNSMHGDLGCKCFPGITDRLYLWTLPGSMCGVIVLGLQWENALNCKINNIL